MTKFENNMSQGSIFKKLILFALPFLASNLVQSLYSVADMIMVGHFAGPEAMSGVNIGGQITFIMTHIIFGFCMGATVLIGQYIGSGNREGLKKVTATIFTLLIISAAIISGVMLIFKGAVLELINTPAESYAESDAYLTVTVTGLIFIFGYNALSAVLRGMGDSKSPLIFVSIACSVNIALNFIFIAGLGWGAFGAAFTTVISQALSMFLCIIYMIRRNFHFDFKPSSFKIYKDQLRLIFKIGLPSAVQNGVVSLSFLFLTAIVNLAGGMSASAAAGAVGRFNSFVFMPVIALSMSISTISAQNIGAGKLDRAAKACRIGTVIAACISYSFFALVQIFPQWILGLFGSDPQMIADGAAYLRTFSFDFLVIPFVFCINGLLIGGGHTMFTLFNSILSSVILRIPVCYIFGITLEYGIAGVGVGVPVASFGSLILIIWFLLSGKWKRNATGITPAALHIEE
jgi:putative MATE family efflux protein